MEQGYDYKEYLSFFDTSYIILYINLFIVITYSQLTNMIILYIDLLLYTLNLLIKQELRARTMVAIG